VRIETFRPELAEAFDEFLLTNPRSLFYSSSKYRHFLTELLDSEDESLLALEGNTVRGVLPLLSMSGEWGKIYNSLPFYGSNGGVLADSVALGGEIMRAYDALACIPTTLSSTIVDHPTAPQESLVPCHNYVDSRIGQFTNIAIQANHQEEILARIDASARRNVKKAQREGVTVVIDHTQFDRLRELHQGNMQAISGTPKSDEFFALVPRYFESGQDYDLYVAKRDGSIIAALLVFYFNRTVEYFTPAIDSDFRSIQPLSLIVLAAMTDASRRGFAWWNWGGTWTSQSGVYRFKAKWAASRSTYSYYTQLNDESILYLSPAEILTAYPNFFVVPFSAIKSGGAADE
jgi:hypothetical protein